MHSIEAEALVDGPKRCKGRRTEEGGRNRPYPQHDIQVGHLSHSQPQQAKTAAAPDQIQQPQNQPT